MTNILKFDQKKKIWSKPVKTFFGFGYFLLKFGYFFFNLSGNTAYVVPENENLKFLFRVQTYNL